MSRNKSLLGSVIKGTSLLLCGAGAIYGGIALNKTLRNNGIMVKIKSIASEIAEKNTTILDFNEIVPEYWDNMYIFETYTSYDTIEAALGFEWDDVYKTGISYRDDITLLVFATYDKVVRYIEYPKAYGDFTKLDQDFYTEGVFELSKCNDKIYVSESFKD